MFCGADAGCSSLSLCLYNTHANTLRLEEMGLTVPAEYICPITMEVLEARVHTLSHTPRLILLARELLERHLSDLVVISYQRDTSAPC